MSCSVPQSSPKKRGRKKKEQQVLSVDPHAQLGTTVNETNAAVAVSVKVEPATTLGAKKRAPVQRKPRGKKVPAAAKVKAEATAGVLELLRGQALE